VRAINALLARGASALRGAEASTSLSGRKKNNRKSKKHRASFCSINIARAPPRIAATALSAKYHARASREKRREKEASNTRRKTDFIDINLT